MTERMVLEEFLESGEKIINSPHFADDTTVIADSIYALNILLEIVSRRADIYHLESHPESTFSTPTTLTPTVLYTKARPSNRKKTTNYIQSAYA